jgi:hypothetical protein
MAANAWKKAAWPGALASKKVEPKGERGGNDVKSYPDQHGQERHQHKSEPEKAKVIKTDD